MWARIVCSAASGSPASMASKTRSCSCERHVELAVQVEACALASLSEQRADEVDGEAVLGHLADRRVEDHVGGIEPGLVLDGVAHVHECLAQSLQLVRRATTGGIARDDPLE